MEQATKKPTEEDIREATKVLDAAEIMDVLEYVKRDDEKGLARWFGFNISGTRYQWRWYPLSKERSRLAMLVYRGDSLIAALKFEPDRRKEEYTACTTVAADSHGDVCPDTFAEMLDERDQEAVSLVAGCVPPYSMGDEHLHLEDAEASCTEEKLKTILVDEFNGEPYSHDSSDGSPPNHPVYDTFGYEGKLQYQWRLIGLHDRNVILIGIVTNWDPSELLAAFMFLNESFFEVYRTRMDDALNKYFDWVSETISACDSVPDDELMHRLNSLQEGFEQDDEAVAEE